MNEPNDEQYNQLTERLKASDREAFDQLFRSLYAPLVRFSFRYTRQKSTAADIIQDAFIKLWHHRESIDAEQSIKAYLYKIVRNLSLNHIRDRSFEQNGLDAADMPADQLTDEDQETDLRTERLELLKKWIMELPERQSEAFRLSRFEGLDHEEIADVMNVSSRTVNNHIVQAMKNIHRLHEQYLTETRHIGYG